MTFCGHYIEIPEDPHAGTYCKLLDGHQGDHSPNYPVGEFTLGDRVRFLDEDNEIVEGRVHALDGVLAVVRGDDARSWIVEKGAMLVIGRAAA